MAKYRPKYDQNATLAKLWNPFRFLRKLNQFYLKPKMFIYRLQFFLLVYFYANLCVNFFMNSVILQFLWWLGMSNSGRSSFKNSYHCASITYHCMKVWLQKRDTLCLIKAWISTEASSREILCEFHSWLVPEKNSHAWMVAFTTLQVAWTKKKNSAQYTCEHLHL